MKKLAFLSFAILLLAACGREYYKTSSYEELALQHEVLAILPVETITTGRIPPEFTDEAILQIEEGESKAFQIALYSQLTRRSGPYYGDIMVNFQHYTETNDRLAKAGISIRDSWTRSPSELAELLGVDAVVRTTIEKEYYLTDLESFGIDLGASLAFIFSDGWVPWWLFPSPRTSDVRATCAVLDAERGLPVWSTDKTRPTYWNKKHREVVYDISRIISRRFPYRGL